MGTVALRPPALAATRVSPAESAVTTPVRETVATDGVEDDQKIVCPFAGCPSAVVARADNVTDDPSRTDTVGGVSVIVSTAGALSVGDAVHCTSQGSSTASIVGRARRDHGRVRRRADADRSR
jgi:hypothetical protein